MSIKFRPLNKAAELIEATELEVTYAYDDLVFASHSVYILRFDDDDDKKIHLHFNINCEKDDKDRLFHILSKKASSIGVFIENDTAFDIITNAAKEELEIVFQEPA